MKNLKRTTDYPSYQTEAGNCATYDVSVHKGINLNPDFEYANGYAYVSTNEWTSKDDVDDHDPVYPVFWYKVDRRRDES